jgi:hypothetical protein
MMMNMKSLLLADDHLAGLFSGIGALEKRQTTSPLLSTFITEMRRLPDV